MILNHVACEPAATREGISSNGRHTVGDGEGAGESLTSKEFKTLDNSDVVGNDERTIEPITVIKPTAAIEGSITNGRHTVRNGEGTSEPTAALESSGANCCRALWNHQSSSRTGRRCITTYITH